MSKQHDTEQAGSVSTNHESLMASESSHAEAIRREAGGNSLTMNQMAAGGAAGKVIEDEVHSTATSHPNDTSDIESYNACVEGVRG
ncbi:hypothetical protein HKX48_006625, partial [Thoreauomyces humboldtii]